MDTAPSCAKKRPLPPSSSSSWSSAEEKNNQGEDASPTKIKRVEHANLDQNDGALKYYHVEDFMQTVVTVMDKDRHLFTGDELHCIGTFLDLLDEPCQRLFIRVYNRSILWFHEKELEAKYAVECKLSRVRPCMRHEEYSKLGQELLSATSTCVYDMNDDDEGDDDDVILVSITNAKTTRSSVSACKDVHSTAQENLSSLSSSSSSPSLSSSSIAQYIDKLVQYGFFEECDANDHDLKEVLNTLTTAQIKQIYAQVFRTKKLPSDPKSSLISKIINGNTLTDRRQSKLSSYFSVQSKSDDSQEKTKLLQHIQRHTGRITRISERAIDLFRRRIHTLCFLGQNMDSKSMILETMQVVKFPKYCIQPTSVFTTRDDFVRYLTAIDLEQTIFDLATEREQFDPNLLERVTLGLASETARYLASRSNSPHSSDPSITDNYYLLRFTAGWVYARTLHYGVEMLEKCKQYDQAVLYLRTLLDSPYRRGKRGSWYNRLCIDLQHLNQNTLALEACTNALEDGELRTHDRIALEKRRKQLQQKCKVLATSRSELDLTSSLLNATHRHIRGKYEKRYVARTAQKSLFLSYNGDNTVTVEELAMEYYAQRFNLCGIHSEGSIYYSLFALLMYDIIFDDTVPHVFQNRYQSGPLDLLTDAFYQSRKNKIEERVASIAESVDTALELVSHVYEQHLGEQIAGMDWKRFGDLHQLEDIVRSLGGPVLSQVLKMISEDYRNLRAGMPDLLLYTETNRPIDNDDNDNDDDDDDFDNAKRLTTAEYKSVICEVKGPRDRLSDKQSAWIDALCRAGAQVEVCHIHEPDKGANRRRKSTTPIVYDDNEIFH